MVKKEISNGVTHKIPSDLMKIVKSNVKLKEIWNNLTPLSRNEWICWITSVKKSETRKNHIERACEDLLNGKRRPCCWPGCKHRRDFTPSSNPTSPK